MPLLGERALVAKGEIDDDVRANGNTAVLLGGL